MILISETGRARRLLARFASAFGPGAAIVVRAPGRVNLLGEHTDYNEGFVLPAAIDRSVLVVARQRGDRIVNVHSINLRRAISFSLDDGETPAGDRFRQYVQGIGRCLEGQGYTLRGVDAVIEGNVPIGSGLSSSAALEMAVLLCFEAASGHHLPPVEKARIGQRVENEFIGVQSGIMDQLASLSGKRGFAVWIDCRSLASELVPLAFADVNIVLCDSGVKRSLATSEYNRRRDECRAVVETVSWHFPDIRSPRDVTPGHLDALAGLLPEVLERRFRHVVNENARVLEGVVALRRGDLPRFGELMYESHGSLRDLYQVSCRELDVLVDAGSRVGGVFGSRMTGAGFGGCSVSLVAKRALERFMREVSDTYRRSTGRRVRITICEPSDGAGRLLELGGARNNDA